MIRLRTYRLPLLLTLFFVLNLVFWLNFYSYHLLHKEQMMLFMNSKITLLNTINQYGGLGELLGDFLTQGYHSKWGAAVIQSALLTAWGFIGYRTLSCFFSKAIALPGMIGLMLWEGGRSCLLNYPLSSTLSLLVAGLLFLGWNKLTQRNVRIIIGIFFLAIAGFGFGYTIWALLLFMIATEIKRKHYKMGLLFCLGFIAFPFFPHKPFYGFGKPNFDREYILALDYETLENNNQRLAQLLTEDRALNWGSFYYNLYQANVGNLPDQLLKWYQPATLGLILPIGPSSSYLSMLFAGELWYRLGDLTMAEHCTMLGMIFSPNQVSSRALKRLALINLQNKDTSAALKYLRMLQKTSVHRSWANEQISLLTTNDTEEKAFLQADTLRKAENVLVSLRSLIQANPNNRLAYQYLLCYELLTKDLNSFEQDFRPDFQPAGLFAEAALIFLARNQQLNQQGIKKYHIPLQTLRNFEVYTQLYEADPNNVEQLAKAFGETYWFYYHFASFER